MVNRLLHEPTLRLKAASDRDGTYVYVQALRELFGIEPGTGPLAREPAEPRATEVTSLESRRKHKRSG